MEALQHLVAMLNGFEGPLSLFLILMVLDTNRQVRALRRQLTKTRKVVAGMQQRRTKPVNAEVAHA